MTRLQAPNIVGGEWQPSRSGAWGARHGPADGSELGRYAASGRAKATFAAQGVDILGSVGDLEKFFQTQDAKWAPVIQKTGIKAE